MNRQHFLLVASLSAAFVGCADGIEEESAHAVYSPSTGNIPVPNDLLYSGTLDLTINVPVADPTDTSNPANALNALDGWSTVAPFTIPFSAPIDPSTAVPGQTLRIFEVTADTTIAPVGGPVTGIIGELSDFDVVSAPGDPSGASLEVRPTTPLAPRTVYMVLVTSGVKDTEGRPVVRDLEYQVFAADGLFYGPSDGSIPGTVPDDLAFGAESLVEAMLFASAAVGIDRADVVVSYTFTTTSIGSAVSSALLASIGQENAVANAIIGSPFGAVALDVDGYDLAGPGEIPPATAGAFAESLFQPTTTPNVTIYEGSMTVPYFCDVSNAAADPSALAGSWEARFPLLADGSRNLTWANSLPRAKGVEEIAVMVSVPNSAATPLSSVPTVLYFHGLGGDRTQMFSVAEALAAEGLAAISIDFPLHGVDENSVYWVGNTPGALRERTFGIDLDGVAGADPSGTYYLNLASLLTAQGNTLQTVVDCHNLRLTLPAFDVDGNGSAGDLAAVAVCGYSTGGIFALPAMQLESTVLAAAFPSGPLPVIAPMVGGGIAKLLQGSVNYNPLVDGSLAANGVLPGTSDYELFYSVAQNVVDTVDPINYAATMPADVPLYFIEAIGGGVDGETDQTVPNSVPFAPLSGTEPLATVLGLTTLLGTDGSVSGAPVRAIGRFVEGGHGTFLDPTDQITTNGEQQAQMAEFAGNGGTEITVNNGSVMQ